MILRRISAALLLCVLSACSFGEKIVLGKLGQVTEPTKIFVRPDNDSQVCYKIKAYEYIVLRPMSKTWMKVLLQNRQFGYIQTDTVAMLPYQVTVDAPSRDYTPPMGSRSTAAAAQYALNFVGTPYVWGGNDPKHGIDCSGLVQQMYGEVAHIQLPRTAAEQATVGMPVRRLEDLRPGDRLYFWEAKRGKIGHTGIYLGKGYFVHSSRTHNGVATDYLGSKKWLNILVAARRS